VPQRHNKGRGPPKIETMLMHKSRVIYECLQVSRKAVEVMEGTASIRRSSTDNSKQASVKQSAETIERSENGRLLHARGAASAATANARLDCAVFYVPTNTV